MIGALLTMAGFFIYQSNLEKYHFSRLVHSSLGLPPAHADLVPQTEENAVRIMNKVHNIMDSRYGQIADLGHPEPGLLWSSDEHLIEPSGACASYTQVLGKSLQTAGFSIRKVGLAKDGLRGIHHVLEAKIDERWVLMDALSNLVFRRPDGHIATAAEVHADWGYYGKQTPPNYNPSYDYSGYYYTNWRKVPLIGFVVESIPPLHNWLQAKGVSLWFLLLDVNQWFAGFAVTGAIMLLLMRAVPRIRKNLRSRRGGKPPEAPLSAGDDEEPTADGTYRTTLTGIPT